ncbi:MAG: type I-E CRISPR-associated protein Cas7/Cse4/CasC, partial [Caldilineaceae bacterium]|nr:type I-E CRISPR-associated protein Cas7/Cse4/CasC [Caldilineaceae bacterium]
MTTTKYLELHLLQNFAPSNLNRDDTGSPKDCEFGGVRRARISSQCLKRALRETPTFAEVTGVEKALRTKRVKQQIRARLPEAKQSDDATETILDEVVKELLSKLDKDGERTAVLLYMSDAELQAIADAIIADWERLDNDKERGGAVKELNKTLTKQFKDRTSAPDIALFGHMLAESPTLNIDAACQVAHALSTHRVTMEMDFYTAVDDLNPDDSAGAGMMGFSGYDSACFYRYLRLDWGQLTKNLDGDGELARKTVEGFIRAAIEAVPTGKQNSSAAHNPPSLVLAVVRNGGMGWSLANAFERPVRPTLDSGFVEPSVKKLDEYWSRLGAIYGTNSVANVAVLGLDA